MSKRILILGAGVMQGPAIKLARERGWKTVVADGDPSAPCAGLADRFERIDLKDKDGMEALARELREDGGLDGVMTAGTDFSATVAWVAERLGFPGISYETALDASDKERMRERFRAEGVPSPSFTVLRSVAEAGGVLPFAFPVVVKPVDNMGSRGCRKVETSADLPAAVSDALGYSRSGRAIVEEYMDGPEFSVDSLVHEGEITICGLADRHIFFPPYFIEMGHTIPTALPGDVADELLAVFMKGVRALGIRNGAAKGDVKLTARGPMIGEIAARLSGGYMSGWTWPYASGVLPTSGALSIAVGERPSDLAPKRNWTCAERAFISIPGLVSRIIGLEAARAAEGIRDVFVRSKAGDRVRFPENNVTKCGNVIASAPTRGAAVLAAEAAARSILIVLEPGDAETDAFLGRAPGGDTKFPPDAFDLDPALLAGLSALDEGPAGAVSPADLAILPFKAFENSGLRDLVGRTVEETLEAARALTGLPLPRASSSTPPQALLGRPFWVALARGGYQGAAYYVESLTSRR